MEDNDIIDLYWARQDEAIVQTESKYGRYCRYIAQRILSDSSDTEEILNDTFLKMWNTIPPNRPQSLKAYVGMIARQLSIDRYNAMNTQKRGGGQMSVVLDELAECIPDSEHTSDIHEGIALKDALNKFIRSLPADTQRVFVRRYWYAASLKEIAEEYGMNESTVSVQLLRTRRKLKKFLAKEGFDV